MNARANHDVFELSTLNQVANFSLAQIFASGKLLRSLKTFVIFDHALASHLQLRGLHVHAGSFGCPQSAGSVMLTKGAQAARLVCL